MQDEDQMPRKDAFWAGGKPALAREPDPAYTEGMIKFNRTQIFADNHRQLFSFWFIMIIRIHPCPKSNFLYNRVTGTITIGTTSLTFYITEKLPDQNK
jgi:hypothetical protein